VFFVAKGSRWVCDGDDSTGLPWSEKRLEEFRPYARVEASRAVVCYKYRGLRAIVRCKYSGESLPGGRLTVGLTGREGLLGGSAYALGAECAVEGAGGRGPKWAGSPGLYHLGSRGPPAPPSEEGEGEGVEYRILRSRVR